MDGEIKENLLANGAEERDAEEIAFNQKLWDENKKLWVVAAPAIFTRFSTFGVNVISQAFIGHIGSIELAAFSLVTTVLFRLANGILLGMASGLETLCGQSYGAKQYHMLGIYLQRSWLVLFMSWICLLPLFIFASPILKALGQEDNIADASGYISLWLIPVTLSFILSFTCQMYLQAQSKNSIISYLAAATLLIHVTLSWLFTVKFDFGLPGALVSTIFAYWIPNVGQLIFVMCGGCPETWKGFSILAFKDLCPIVKLSLSSGGMICLEFWYYTVLILLTGHMTNAEVAIDALSICLNINGWEMMIAFGFMGAASVRVANELGRGSSKAAKFAIVNVALTSLAIGFLLFLLFLFLRDKVAYIFTNDLEVANAVGDLSPLLAFSILLNSLQPVLSGIAIGAGWQSIVAYVNIACYYLIGIPIGVVLGYVLDWGVKGVWMGMLFGTLIQTIVLIIVTYRTDWEKQVTVAKNRLNRWSVRDTSDENRQNA